MSRIPDQRLRIVAVYGDTEVDLDVDVDQVIPADTASV